MRPGSDQRGWVAISWTWPAGIRVMLAVVVLISGVVLRTAIFFQGSDSAAAYSKVPDLVIDPNNAPASVLEALPHLGPSLVGRLIAERRIRPFESTEDLRRRVRGLGPATLARLGPHLRIEPVSRDRESAIDPTMDPVPGQPRLAQAPNPPAR